MKVLLAFFIIYCSLSIEAQTKLSPWLRQIVKKEARLSPHTSHLSPHSSHLTTIAFVRLSSDDDDALTEHGCQSLAHFGDLHIAAIPLSQLPSMCADNRIMRIEASPCGHVLMDTTSIILNATQAYEGINLPQAYSGNGVVVGVMDIGFDLTHPNFYSADTTRYRIKRFWDMLSQDTIGSAAALTGGYGNSYAQNAGNQAYNQYLLGLFDQGSNLRFCLFAKDHLGRCIVFESKHRIPSRLQKV